MREVELLKDGWKFVHVKKGTSLRFLSNAVAEWRKQIPVSIKSESDWEDVCVPHDWDIRGPFLESHSSGTSGGYAPCGLGWYRKLLNIDSKDKGKKIFLRFDGVYKRATLWLNGKRISKHYYGYGPFEVDITDVVNFSGKNALFVQVNNLLQPSCRWYTGSGIYRNVYLIKTSHIYLPWGSIFVRPKEVGDNEEKSEIEISTEVQNESGRTQEVILDLEIFNGKSERVASKRTTLNLGKKSKNLTLNKTNLTIPKTIRWDVNNPHLYNIRGKISQKGGKLLDDLSERFGLRKISFDGKGFHLNGKTLKLKGVCLHHDGGCVGSAVPKAVWKRRFEKLKSMGSNSIRTSHNIPARNFVELADEMGLLLIDEAFDKWMLRPRVGAWGGKNFKRDWKQELRNFVRRDRNSPSVVLWSLGNEVKGIQKASIKAYHSKMYDFVKSLDPTRPVTTVLSPNNTRKELKRVRNNKPPFIHEMVDVYCTNYTEKYLQEIHESIPNKAIIIAEAHHWYRNKSKKETHLPTSDLHPKCTHRNPWYDVEENEFCAGQYLWVGIEYLGEVRDPYPYHGRTNAPIRINGFLKPQAGFHSSVWLEVPYVHLSILDQSADIPRGKPQFDFPKIVCHWNFKDYKSKTKEAWVFTNCDSVELLLNGKSLGEKKKRNYPYNGMTFSVDFVPGVLKALGKKNGKEVVTSILKTAGKPDRVCLKCDKTQLRADIIDCVNIEATIVDKSGVRIPMADNQLNFEFEGPIRLLGIDSGDLSSFTEKDAYISHHCNAYWGRALIVVQSTGAGKCKVRVSSKNLKGDEILLQSTR